MKTVFFNFIRHPGRKWPFILSVMGLLLGGNAARATDALAPFTGNIGPTPPTVDATNFYNSGTWNIFVSPQPFKTANTLTYTNVGTMNSSVGWEFDYGPNNSGSSSARGFSSRFFNDTEGIISTTFGYVSFNNFNGLFPVGYLLVSATNLINKGVLSADIYSKIALTGSTVDLHRSTIQITSPFGGSFSSPTLKVFTADFGIFDQYWAQSTLSNMNSSLIWNGTNAQSPSFNASGPNVGGTIFPCGFQTNIPTMIPAFNTVTPFIPTTYGSTRVLDGFLAFTVTNMDLSTTDISLATNEYRQAVFVRTSSSNFKAQIRFSPSQDPKNFFQTVAVQLASPFTNITSHLRQTNFLYLADTLASDTTATARVLQTNLLINPYSECSGVTLRPANFSLSRTDSTLAFASGIPGDGTPPPTNFLYQADFTNKIVKSTFAGYSAYVDDQAFLLGSTYSITNLPGRIEINADNLNINQTTIIGSGEVVIHATNLISSVGALVGSPALSYNFGGPSIANLTVTNIALPNLNDLNGTISCWSVVWTNTENVVTPNYDANGVLTPMTNAVTVNLYALLVDASLVQPQTPVVVQDLVLHATNMVVGDSMNVASTLLFDGKSLTLDGGYFYLYNSVMNWTHAVAPTLRNFTNNSYLYILNDAHFGDDGPTNYLNFVNNGIIYSADSTINADNLQINSGGFIQTSSGNFYGITQTGQLSGAVIYSASDIQFAAISLQMTNTFLEAFNALDFNVTGSLSDGGIGSGNIFTCQNGFNLYSKPATGDLRGTTIITSASFGGAEADHSWAGINHGPSVLGFTNNVTIGQLTLAPQGNPLLFPPLFAFYGVAGTPDGNGMYVGKLDLSQLADFADEIYIDPSLDIYFLSASLNGTNGAEQVLDGQFGNHLHWVHPGMTLVGQAISGGKASGGGFQINNPNAYPGLTNITEASTNLLSTNWIPIFTNVGPSSFIDLKTTNFPFRFYRVKTLP